MTRRSLILGLSGTSLSLWTYARDLEPGWLDLTRTSIPLGRQATHRAIRILHLADLHLSRFATLPMIEGAFQAGLAEKPDLVCITGDFITANEEYDRGEYGQALRRISQAVPTFACLGNHDGGVWAMSRKGHRKHAVIGELLEQSGVRLLHNESQVIEVAGRQLQLIGVGDLWAGEVDGEAAFRNYRNLSTVVLAHNPDTKEILGNYPWQLMLSGHTHGGQVVFPLIGPCFAPVKDRRFIAGLGEWNGRRIYVTRGVGNLWGYRFNCRPEASILELV
jgi:uncharacterized protein